MKKSIVLLIALAVLIVLPAAGSAEPKIVGKYITYKADDLTMKGYLAYDKTILGKRPGVLVVHEWWGQTPYIRERAHMLAKLGYAAFAVDMYGNGKVARHPDDAQKFSSELVKNFDVMKSRFTAAEDVLKKQKMVDPEKIAAIGYCMGGGVVLNVALTGSDLKGVASFHGSLGTVKNIEPGVKTKVIIFTGEADKFNPPEQVAEIQDKLKNAGVDYKLISYPGAMHSFTNPEADKYAKKFKLPLAYNAEADKKSWEELKLFLAGIFQ